MSLYVANFFVLCTLMLLSVTEADEYPVLVKSNFSGIYLHNCDNKQYVSDGAKRCIRNYIPRVERQDDIFPFTTLKIEAMVTEMCSTQDNVSACVTTLFQDCPNKGKIMEGYLGRYVACDGNKPANWITEWARSNSQAQLTRDCWVRNNGFSINNCYEPEWKKSYDWKSLNLVIEDAVIWRRYVSDVFNCILNQLVDYRSYYGIEQQPECDDLGKWSNILTMLFLYWNCDTNNACMYLSEANIETLQNMLYDTCLN